MRNGKPVPCVNYRYTGILGKKDQDVHFFKEVIKAKRLQTIRKIKIIHCDDRQRCDVQFYQTLIRGALQHPGLKELHMEKGDISGLDPDLLAQFLMKMEKVEITIMRLTFQQTTKFLSSLQETNQVKTLLWRDYSSNDESLRRVDPMQLANAVKKVETLQLKHKLTD